jgi:hypothetical protein
MVMLETAPTQTLTLKRTINAPAEQVMQFVTGWQTAQTCGQRRVVICCSHGREAATPSAATQRLRKMHESASAYRRVNRNIPPMP